MTEAEWLTSEDPSAMRGFLTSSGRGTALAEQPLPSDRQFRLFACAAWRTVRFDAHGANDDLPVVEAVEAWADGGPRPAPGRIRYVGTHRLLDDAEAAARHFCLPDHAADAPRRADLLREVFGNPFRPLTLGREWLGCENCNGVALDDHGCPCRYSRLKDAGPLARAAYDVTGSPCGRCGGSGWSPTYGPPEAREHCGRPTQERRDVGGDRGGHWPRWCGVCWATFLPRHTGRERCPDCGGSGRSGDGLLDPARLAVLADSLLDAGCTEESLLMHLRGWGPCWCCLDGQPYYCSACRHERPGWRRLPGPHVRGCWAVDLILGRG